MKEAIIGLIGVAVGGGIGLLGNFLSFNFQNKIWKKERRIDRLIIQKQSLENKYDKCVEELYLSIEKDGKYNAKLFIDAIYSFPKNVVDAISKLTKINIAKKGDMEAQKNAIWDIIGEMQKSLIELEKEIKKEING